MESATQKKLMKGGKFLLELITIVIITGVTASLATQAAFPRLANVQLAESSDYWQNQPDSSLRIAARPLIERSSSPETETTNATTEDTLAPAFPPPTVDAKSYIVADIASGEILASKSASAVFPIASISKLMTAVVASETIDTTSLITVSEEAVATYGAAGGLLAGDELTLESLYYPLLLESSNDAAVAVAEYAGFARFINLMNRKALVLDMGSTRFRGPSGLSDENTSSARDLLRLARYIYDKKPEIFAITTETQALVPQENSAALRNFTNNNPMAGRADFLGGKNGYTDNARRTLLSVFSAEVADQPRNVVIIVLGSESHTEDTLALLSWLKRAF